MARPAPRLARPECRECGGPVDPTQAQAILPAFPRPRWPHDPRMLPGIYCCADCLLDAWVRGFPRYYALGPD